MQTIDGKKLNLFSLFNYTKDIKSDLSQLVNEFKTHVNNDNTDKSYYNLIQIVEDLSERVQDLSERLDYIVNREFSDSAPVESIAEEKTHKHQNLINTWIYKIFKRKNKA